MTRVAKSTGPKEQYKREDGSYSLAAFRLVEELAADNKTQRYIAAQLGVPFRTFEADLNKNKGQNELRLAWERGFAEVEQEVADFMLTQMRANTKGSIIAGIFFAKSRLGWREKDDSPQGNQSNIQIVLPRPMTEEQYYKTLGMSGPDRALNIKDVTPKPAALPAPTPPGGPTK